MEGKKLRDRGSKLGAGKTNTQNLYNKQWGLNGIKMK